MAGVRGLSTVNRFLSHVHKTESCWLWTGYIDKKGRGSFRIKGPNIIQSRAAYILFVGEIPCGLHVLHRCDNPKCVNPEHLFLGTNLDNIKDMISKGRHRVGERKPNAKLSPEHIREILRISKYRYYEHAELAKMYGVSRPLITHILKKQRWLHLFNKEVTY